MLDGEKEENEDRCFSLLKCFTSHMNEKYSSGKRARVIEKKKKNIKERERDEGEYAGD